MEITQVVVRSRAMVCLLSMFVCVCLWFLERAFHRVVALAVVCTVCLFVECRQYTRVSPQTFPLCGPRNSHFVMPRLSGKHF